MGTDEMSVKFIAVAAAFVAFVATTSAEARPWDPSMDAGWKQEAGSYSSRADRKYRAGRTVYRASAYRSGRARGGNGRPRQWCGWWMRQQRGGGPEMNLAWNWSRWGRASSPQVGAVVVWRHHVGEIVGRAANGRWLVRSGNDGGAVRTRARSVAGAVFRMG
jgi:hypothetical protein